MTLTVTTGSILKQRLSVRAFDPGFSQIVLSESIGGVGEEGFALLQPVLID